MLPAVSSDDPGVGVHDRVLAFARERGLRVRPDRTVEQIYRIEAQQGEMTIEVTFENSR